MFRHAPASLLLIGMVAISAVAFQGQPTKSTLPDLVPDRQTALRIADAVLVARYGESVVAGMRPLAADDVSDHWTVGPGRRSGSPRGSGGGPFITIDKRSGCLRLKLGA